MKRGGKTIMCLAAGLALPMLAGAANDTAGGPYHAIVARNIFDLRDPPAPVEHADTTPPPNVKLIGLMLISGRPQGVFSLMPMGPGRQATTCILGEDERHESLDVKSIDMAAKRAKVQIGSDMVTLKLEEPKAEAGGMPGAIPGAGPGGLVGGRGMQGGRVGMAGRGGFAQTGGGGYNPVANPSAPGAYPQGSSYSPEAGGMLPARQVRTDASDGPPITPEQQVIAMEQARDQYLSAGSSVAGIIPPTPLTAALQAQTEAANQAAANAGANQNQQQQVPNNLPLPGARATGSFIQH